MGKSIQSAQALLKRLRYHHNLSMQIISDQSGISLSSLYRIKEQLYTPWGVQARLWALVQKLEERG